MKGRGNNIACEYLSVIGQQLRHDFVEGIMFQLIKDKLFSNASHYRMYKYLICRATTEIILEQQGITMRQYSGHIDDKMDNLKDELQKGLEIFADECNLSLFELVHSDIV